ncbi:hypothetical protein [Qipengyuania sp.]|uniref:hypothetical protein n=1 Tax=Qipengyuania sp. TaxID=2004515 RepID=UPI0035C861B7
MGRFLRLLAALVALTTAASAAAEVRITFHSFNGSVLFGRYPHTFVSLEGTLDANGATVHENYGWSAKSVTPAVLSRPVEGIIMVEKEKWLTKTNRHFTLTLDDATYWKVRAEVERYRKHPGNFYSLASNNCIHFIGSIARIAGLKVDYPQSMLRKPREWLNHISTLNPRLGAKQIG